MQEELDPMVAMRAMVQIRGLQDGNARTPLERFRGRLVAVSPRQQTFQAQPGQRGGVSTFVDLKFDEVVPIKVREGETYAFETAEISLKLSNQKNSAWGSFSDSLVKWIPADKELFDCIGTVMELESHEKDYGPDRTKQIPDVNNPGQTVQDPAARIRGIVWEVLGVQGSVAAPTSNGNSGPAQEAALRILDGKTAGEFNKEVFTDAVAKSDPNINSMLLNGSFIPTMIQAGKVTEGEGGVYHLVREGAPA